MHRSQYEHHGCVFTRCGWWLSENLGGRKESFWRLSPKSQGWFYAKWCGHRVWKENVVSRPLPSGLLLVFSSNVLLNLQLQVNIWGTISPVVLYCYWPLSQSISTWMWMSLYAKWTLCICLFVLATSTNTRKLHNRLDAKKDSHWIKAHEKCYRPKCWDVLSSCCAFPILLIWKGVVRGPVPFRICP